MIWQKMTNWMLQEMIPDCQSLKPEPMMLLEFVKARKMMALN